MNSQHSGIPAGMLCRSVDVQKLLNVSFDTWKAWKDAGLVTLNGLGTAEMVLTSEVIRFVESNPQITKRKR